MKFKNMKKIISLIIICFVVSGCASIHQPLTVGYKQSINEITGSALEM